MAETTQIVNVPLRSVKKGDSNVRSSYALKTLEELGRSMREIGTLQPILVEPRKRGGYQLVSGSRRIRAARRMKLPRIPALVVSNISGRDKLILALSENLHRESLTPLEEASVLGKLTSQYKMNPGELARKIGKDESFIRRRVQLLNLPQDVQRMVAKKQLGVVHAEVLTDVKKPEEQLRLAQVTVKNRLSADEVVTLIGEELKRKTSKRRPQKLHGRKINLRIKEFSRWLRGVMPEVVEMPIGKMASVKCALRGLVEHASTSISALSASYKK